MSATSATNSSMLSPPPSPNDETKIQYLMSMDPLELSFDDMIRSRRNSERLREQGRSRGLQHGRGSGGSSSSGGRAYGAPRRSPPGLNARSSNQMISNGSAEVVYFWRSDAYQALEQYNNAQLNGNPMKVEIFCANDEIPFYAPLNAFGGAGEETVEMGSLGGSIIDHGGGRGGGHGRDVGHERNILEKSHEELDKKLERYFVGGSSRVVNCVPVQKSLHDGGGLGGSHGRDVAHGRNILEKSHEDLDKELERYFAEGSSRVDNHGRPVRRSHGGLIIDRYGGVAHGRNIMVEEFDKELERYYAGGM